MKQEFIVFNHISIHCYTTPKHPGLTDLEDLTLENHMEQFMSELEIFVHSKSHRDMVFEIVEEPDYTEQKGYIHTDLLSK